MTESSTQTRTCRYPGCDRPAAASEDGVGRPPEYCDDPTHTRASAWRARHIQQAAAAGRAAPEDLGRPVAMAGARAETIASQVGSQIAALTTALSQVVAELHTLGDPDAAAAQIETVTTEADQRIAEASARAARAEQDRRTSEQQRAEADVAAEEATEQLETITRQFGELRAAYTVIVEELAQARTSHAEETERLRVEALRSSAEAATARERAGVAEVALADAVDQVQTLTGELEQVRAELVQAHAATAAETQRATDLETSRAALAAEVAIQRERGAAAERDAATAGGESSR